VAARVSQARRSNRRGGGHWVTHHNDFAGGADRPGYHKESIGLVYQGLNGFPLGVTVVLINFALCLAPSVGDETSGCLYGGGAPFGDISGGS